MEKMADIFKMYKCVHGICLILPPSTICVDNSNGLRHDGSIVIDRS